MEAQLSPEEDQEEEFHSSVGNLMDSRTSHLDDVLVDKLTEAFLRPTFQTVVHDLAKIASEYDPIDLAYAVSHLPPTYRYVLYENLPDLEAKIEFIINTSSITRNAVFRQIANNELIQLIENMPPDEGVWALEDMPERRLRCVLDLLSLKKANLIRELLKHSQHSAGRMMTNEFFAFSMHRTVGEAAAIIRDNPSIDLTRRVFVVNDEGELQGYISSRNLIVNPSDMPLKQVMQPVLHKVTPEVPRDEVVDLVERYKIPALPVVDREDHLVGVVTFEDVVEAIEDIADETIGRLAGTAEDISEDEPVFKRFLGRAPWLAVTLLAGLLSAEGLSFFQHYPWFLFVSPFLPLITGMSGNVGIQCSTVLVRAMATGELSSGSKGEAAIKEFLIGLMVGVSFGLASGILVYTLNAFGVYPSGSDPFVVGGIVSAGVLCACLTATTLGTLTPFLFARIGFDPAVSSGPIVTAFNDVISALMYFLTARVLTLLMLPHG